MTEFWFGLALGFAEGVAVTVVFTTVIAPRLAAWIVSRRKSG